MIHDDDGNGRDRDDDGDVLVIYSIDGEVDPLSNVIGTFGQLDWESNGSYRYELDTANPLLQTVEDGVMLADTFS